MEVKCWICGELANSEEHKFKASDLKRHYEKKYGIKNEMLFKSEDVEKKIESYKSKELKFSKVICIDCNNNRTKPHDNAYDKYTEYIRDNKIQIYENKKIDYFKMFGENWIEQKKNLYRYYAKHAGCKIVTGSYPYEISNLSSFILDKENNTTLKLHFQFKEGMIHVNNFFNGEFVNLFNGNTICFGQNSENLNFGGWCSYQWVSVNWVVSKEIKLDKIPNFNSQFDEVEILHFVDCSDLGEGSDDILERIEYHKNLTINDQIEFFKSMIN